MGRLTQADSPRATGRYAPLAPTRELTVISADGARIHTEIHGPEDGPPVVLAHGWTCSIPFWAAVTRELISDGHRVIVYDQRGHGRSPAATPYAYNPATLSDDLCAVLETVLQPGEKAVLGGHSMGGMTLMAAAGRRQLTEHAAALMLCSTGAQRLLRDARVVPLRSPRARARAHRLVLGARAPLGPVTPVSRSALKYGTLGPGATREQSETVARLVHDCPTGVRAAWGAVLADLDLHTSVWRLNVPTAVISGTADRLTPFEHARELAAALPDCAGLHRLTGLGHMTPIEAPEAVSGLLRQLVADHLTGAAQHTAGSTAGSANPGEGPATPAAAAGVGDTDGSGKGKRRAARQQPCTAQQQAGAPAGTAGPEGPDGPDERESREPQES